MMIYEIELTKSAQKELKKLPKQVSLRIVKSLYKLRSNPRKGNVRSMVGVTSWRLRVGDYRVIYDILEGRLRILVIRVQHRKDVYRG